MTRSPVADELIATPPATSHSPVRPLPASAKQLTVTLLDRLDSVDAEEWAALFTGHPDSFEMCRLVANGQMKGFSFSSLVVRRDGVPVLFLPLFQTDFDLSELVGDGLSRLMRMAAALLPRIFKPRLLGVGFVEGEWGAAGVRTGEDAETIRHAWDLAMASLDQLARHRRSDIVLFLNFLDGGPGDVPAEYATHFSTIDAYPCGRVALPFGDVNGYLASLSKSSRKDIGRKLKPASQISIVRTTEPGDRVPQIHELYVRTVESADLALGMHAPAYFARVCRDVPGAEYVLYFLNDRLIAFNLLVATGDALVDKYFAMDPVVGREHNLYFVSWMENVRHCIEQKIPTYHAGPGAEATKARLGATFLPCVTRFRHQNRLVHRFLRGLRPLLAYKPAVDVSAGAASGSVAAAVLTPVCLDLDGSVSSTQPAVTERIAETLDLKTRGPHLRLSAGATAAAGLRAEIQRLRDRRPTPWLTFIGSGDYHFVSLLLLETLPKELGPVTLVLIDNHPDWCAEWPKYHCGNWAAGALKLPSVRSVVMLGQDSDDFRWYRSATAPYAALRSGRLQLRPLRMEHLAFPLRWRQSTTRPTRITRRPWGNEVTLSPLKSCGVSNVFRELAHSLAGQNVYISVDKDCLRPSDAVTDWEQGGLSLDELTAGLRALAGQCNIVGADVCGERAPAPLTGFVKRLDAGRLGAPTTPPAGWERLNERANLAILDALVPNPPEAHA